MALSEAKGFGLPEGAAFPARVGSMGCNYTALGREPAGRERELAGGTRRAGDRAERTHVTLIDSLSRCGARALLGYVVFPPSGSRTLAGRCSVLFGKLRHAQHL